MLPVGQPAYAKITTRVVLFHAPGAGPAKAILAALTRPGVKSVHASHPWKVLAGVLAPGASSRVVVLLEPGSLPRVAEVLEAIAKYARQVKVWIFDAAASPALRAATDSDLALLRLGAGGIAPRGPAPSAPAAPTPAAAAAAFIAGPAAAPVRTVSVSPPALKLTDADPGVNTWIMSPQTPGPIRATAAAPSRSLTQAPPPEHAMHPPLLSAEELAMLLSEDPEKCT